MVDAKVGLVRPCMVDAKVALAGQAAAFPIADSCLVGVAVGAVPRAFAAVHLPPFEDIETGLVMLPEHPFPSASAATLFL